MSLNTKVGRKIGDDGAGLGGGGGANRYVGNDIGQATLMMVVATVRKHHIFCGNENNVGTNLHTCSMIKRVPQTLIMCSSTRLNV